MARWTIDDVNIVDGTGSLPFRGRVTVDGDRICGVEKISDRADADLTVTPGFIDMHSHSDLPLYVDGRAVSKVSQGITTEVIGQCGISGAPLYGHMVDEIGRYFDRHGLDIKYRTMDEYLSGLDRRVAVNVVALIGHGTMRRGIRGEGSEPSTPDEIQRMQEAVDESMKAGARGLSTGLIYAPGCYTPTEEVIAITKAIRPYQGLYFTHLRNEGDRLVEAVEEAIRIVQEAGVGLQLSHHKAMGPHNWGKTHVTLSEVTDVIEGGLDVYLDQYPYEASATDLSALLPDWALDGGKARALERLQDAEARRRIVEEIDPKETRFGWHRTHVGTVSNPIHKSLEGRSLQAIADQWQVAPMDALIKILAENQMRVSMIRFGMGMEDIERVFRFPRTLIGTDGGAVAPDGPLSGGHPHPRSYGTFPRVLRDFVVDKQWISLAEAIYRMTGMAAERLNLLDRGKLQPGYYADLVVMNLDEVRDCATFDNPHQPASGFEAVYTNGVKVWDGKASTGLMPGGAIRFGR